MLHESVSLGLDIGALTVKLAILNEQGDVIERHSQPHHGEIFTTTHALLQDTLPNRRIARLGIIGSQAEPVAQTLGFAAGNDVAAIIRAVTDQYENIKQIIDIGGGSLSMITLNDAGEFTGYQTNTLCAAGTGSFLDEQAARLGIEYAQLDDMPEVASPPSIAARCAVFAKSDLIHRQQEGYDKPSMWSGLCRGLTHTIVMTLFKGRTPAGTTAVVGGVAQNREVLRWLKEELKVELIAPPSPQETAAVGAALNAPRLEGDLPLDRLLDSNLESTEKTRRPKLTLTRSNYPSFEVEKTDLDDGNEIRISRWPADGHLTGYLGIDIGSTSTKCVLIDTHDEVLVDIYRKTGGDPIGATQSLFRSLSALVAKRGGQIDILGVGTTGSGRKLVGAVTGADYVINEITAHVTGAMKVDPSIDTIFEIGGQDAKYIHAVEGRLHNSNMNYVCAAGTGSFVEELSRKMGFDLFSLGDEVLGVEPPVTSDRCTVFMEQDARALLRKGFTPREVMGAVMVSVVQNYLNKVVGNRYYSKEKVFFQGATARNKSLVAAFETLLGVEVVVSPYCHQMGSFGVALIVKQRMEENQAKTRFVGLDFAEKPVTLSKDECSLCANRCAITYAEVDGLTERPSWGYLCGREPDEKAMRINREFALMRQRNRLWKEAAEYLQPPKNAPVIGMPRALLAHSHYPFWRRFFAELGYDLQLSAPTDRRIIEKSSDWVGADYCFPVKLAHGHLRDLLENDTIQQVFIPFMVSAGHTEKATEAYFCPYNIALPAVLGSAMWLNGYDEERLLKATCDFRWDDATAAERLTADLGKRLGRNKRKVAAAWKAAKNLMTSHEETLRRIGRDATAQALAADKPAVVILGRPYNVYDPGANLALPEKIARLGLTVLPMDFLPLDEEDIGEEFRNMYWNYGRKVIEAARFVARTPNLYAVCFSNFSCGPDSFIQTYTESIMGEKPMLMLELDEHGADAGYLTRLEAFADVLANSTIERVPRYTFNRPAADPASAKGRTLWVPPMGEAGAALIAAAERTAGYDAQPLPVEDLKAYLKGRAVTRGGECLPCPATLGTFLSTVERTGNDPSKHALFMPTAEGPCRFGQYCTLDRMAMNRRGWDTVPILSWTSVDTYDGTDEETRRWLWRAIVLSDTLFKLRCRVTPYETDPGAADRLYYTWIDRLSRAVENREKLDPVMVSMRNDFMSIPRHDIKKPLVGIVGEIYVRQNRFTNQELVKRIEQAGGEAWLAPITEWILYTAYVEAWTQGYRSASLLEKMGNLLKNRFMAGEERHFMDLVSPLLDERHEPPIAETVQSGERFVPMDFEGEVIITLGRAIEYMKNGADLVINCAPFGCMPGSITSGIFQRIEREYGVPVANMFYDGEGDLNRLVDIYLSNLGASNGLAATGTNGQTG